MIMKQTYIKLLRNIYILNLQHQKNLSLLYNLHMVNIYLHLEIKKIHIFIS